MTEMLLIVAKARVARAVIEAVIPISVLAVIFFRIICKPN